jgi:hypothetical protein
MIQALPNDIISVTSAAVATVQDCLVSMEGGGVICTVTTSGVAALVAGRRTATNPARRMAVVHVALRQNARRVRRVKFRSRPCAHNEIDPIRPR